MNQALRNASKNEALKHISTTLGIPIVEVHMEHPINTVVEKPISRAKWNAARVEDLRTYIIESSLSGQAIDVEIVNEYNSLIKK